MTTPQADSAVLTMVLEGLSRLEKGQEVIQQELRLLRDSDQSIHARVSNLELALTRQIDENRRLAEVKDKEQEERLREQSESMKAVKHRLERMLYGTGGMAAAAGAGHLVNFIT